MRKKAKFARIQGEQTNHRGAGKKVKDRPFGNPNIYSASLIHRAKVQIRRREEA
jgi:hypothetical protein